MSSKEQLGDYIKRLKKTTEEHNKEIARLKSALTSATISASRLKCELDKIKLGWFDRLLNRFT